MSAIMEQQAGPPGAYKSEVRDGMRIDWDVPIAMQDGIVLRADIFRPDDDARHPALISYGPYGKGLSFQQGYKTAWDMMLRDHPDVLASYRRRFRHVLVDEYQDTNALQAEIVVGLAPSGRGVTAVGDDAQAIYSFRAATVRNILDFPGRFATPARLTGTKYN